MPIFPTELTSNRLHLRRYVAGDADWYAGMARRNRAHLMRYESGNEAMRIGDAGDARRVIAEFAEMAEAGKACFLGAFRKEDDAFACQIYIGVGNADLPGYLIGYFCDADHLRRGYVGEAAATVVDALFGTCGAERIGLGCDDTNVASRRVAEGLGMRLEGHLRADKRHADGSVTGSLLFGLLRQEWQAARTSGAAERAGFSPPGI